MLCSARRDGRADEGAGLENRYGRKFIVGSNPTLSAKYLANIRARSRRHRGKGDGKERGGDG